MHMNARWQELDVRLLGITRNELQQVGNSVRLEVDRGNSSIRYFAGFLFYATYVSLDQLQTLKALRSSFLTLHVGQVCGQWTHLFGLNKIHQHAILASNPVNNGSFISVCEFLAPNVSTISIAVALTQFRDR